MNCKICESKCKKKKILTRSNNRLNLFYCKKCDFEYFSHNPKKKLVLNKLNISRLKKAGLQIPSYNEDFNNGLTQSKNYIKKYIKKNDKKKKILEIGCSFGYFLYSLKKKGFSNVYGLEINKVCKNFVNNKLKIPCFTDLKNIKENVLFDKIFLFYSFEYIHDPKDYLKKLFSKLNKKGKIYIITPNKRDILKDIVPGSNFKNFFYDISSVNYFSKLSFQILAKNLKLKNYSIKTNQGYSLANLFQWYLNKKPMKTNLVGEDKYIEGLIQDIRYSKFQQNNLKKKIISLINSTNHEYKKILSKYNYGNQIIFYIEKR